MSLILLYIVFSASYVDVSEQFKGKKRLIDAVIECFKTEETSLLSNSVNIGANKKLLPI